MAPAPARVDEVAFHGFVTIGVLVRANFPDS